MKDKWKILAYYVANGLMDTGHRDHRGLWYASTDSSIASVSKSGVVKAKKKGTCHIYVYAQNGIAEKVTVKVR